VVWGGPSRLVYHGIASVEGSFDANAVRYNLTFRQARWHRPSGAGRIHRAQI